MTSPWGDITQWTSMSSFFQDIISLGFFFFCNEKETTNEGSAEYRNGGRH